MSSRLVITVVGLMLLVVPEFTREGAFFSKALLSSLTPFIVVTTIASLGQAVVIGGGGIDRSIPSTMTLVGAVIPKLSKSGNARIPGAIAVAIAACAVIVPQILGVSAAMR